ncbi:MAG: ABC transporter substrate-binding protein [Acidimicrobiales bacterium]
MFLHRRRRPVIGVIGALLGISLIAAACSSTPSSSNASGGGSGGTSKAPIYVAVVTALSGTLATYGEADLEGIQVGAQEINAQGGLLGRKLVVVYKDDQSTPSTAALAAQSLVNQYHPSFLFPGEYATSAEADIPFATAEKIITIEPAPAFVDPSKYPYNFNIYFTPDEQALLQAVSLKKVNAHKVAILNSDDTGSAAEASAFLTLFPKLGFDIVAHEAFDPTDVDLSIPIQQAKQAGADTILLQVPSAQFDEAATAVANLGWHNVNLMAGPTADNPQVIQGIPASVVSQFRIASAQIYARPSANALSPAISTFANDIKKFGTLTDIGIAGIGHDIIWDWATAVKRAGTTNTAAVTNQLNSFYKDPVPAGTNITLPAPAWSSTVHDMSTANIQNSYALLQPSSVIDDTMVGKAYTLPTYTKQQLLNFFGPSYYSS